MPVEFDPNSPVRVFISYAHEDAEIASGLSEQLREETAVKFQVLSDFELQPGDVVHERLAEWLHDAQIILLLVSEKFIASKASSLEVDAALRRRSSNHAVVVPVILTRVNWRDTPYANLEALPPGARPIEDWEKAHDAFQAITRSLVRLVASRPVTAAGPWSASGTEYMLSGRQFRTYWLIVSSNVLVVILVLLGFYARQPDASTASERTQSLTAEFLVVSASVGLAAMSLIQIFRRLFRIRGAFHRDAVSVWLDGAAFQELYRRIGFGRISDVFDLPSEMLTGQLSAIAEQAIEERGSNERPSPLVQRMAEGSDPSHRDRPRRRHSPELETDQDIRTTLALAIQRNLDHFQIATAAGWRRYLLLSCVLLSMALFAIGLWLFHAGSFIPGLRNPAITRPDLISNFVALLTGAILVGLFGGFLGTIARDVVAIIEKLRR